MFMSSSRRARRLAPNLMIGALAIAGPALLAACGDDAKGAPAETTAAATPTSTTAATDHTQHGTVPATSAQATTLPAPTTEPVASTTPVTAAPTTEPATTAPAAAASQIDVTTTDYAFELSSDVAAAGPVTFSVTNTGSEPHQIQIAAVPEGYTAEQFVEAFERDGEAAAFASVVWAGGVNGIEPGATEVGTAELQPGHYIVLCFIPTPGEHGTAHLSLGMVDEFDVVDAASPAPEPMPVATIELTDYAIGIPERFTGGVTEVLNLGGEGHELILMRFHEGKSLADLVAWSEAGMPAERPFDYVGGTGTLAPGRRGWATLDLEAGDYVALCVVRTADGHPHVDLGMITPFGVS